jgi:erythromycin esterase
MIGSRGWMVVLVVVAGCRDSSPPTARGELPAKSVERTLEPGGTHRYRFPMKRGESRELVVTQRGVDVVVEGFAPDGARLVSVDSPNGTEGDEPVEVFAASDGEYQLVVRALEPKQSGRYTLTVRAMHDAAATRAVHDARERARGAAVEWLRPRAGAIQLRDSTIAGPGLTRFDLLAKRGRIVGLGEATHGSRQFGDVRLALTLRLIEQHGVRVIGLEGSAARMRLVDAWTRGGEGDLETMIGAQWINRRAFTALANSVRAWNAAHSQDPVSIVGLDDADHAPAREVVAAFVRRAYDAAFASQVDQVLDRLAQADAQAMVFGPSDVSAEDWKFLVDLLAKLEALDPKPAAAIAATRTLAQVSEFNAGGPRSRDWMMAENLMREIGPDRRAVFWGHNAHVAHPPDNRGQRAPTGGRLAELTPYVAIAITFYEGGFLAQLADDPQRRLQTFTIPAAADESIDAVLGAFGDAIVTWPDGADGAPPWLLGPRAMHWIGALFSKDLAPNQWSRDASLLGDYDGVVMFRRVDAEASPEIGKNRAPASSSRP